MIVFSEKFFQPIFSKMIDTMPLNNFMQRAREVTAWEPHSLVPVN
jgi:hypothetical protein